MNIENNIKIIISDFDGIFTDGSIFVFDDGKTCKRLHYADIMGIALADKKGYSVVIISGEKSASIDYLDKKFPKLEVHQNIRNKFALVNEILSERGLSFSNVAYLGDDINDLECLKAAQIAYSVDNANYKLKEAGIKILEHQGGNGAFRELVDLLP